MSPLIVVDTSVLFAALVSGHSRLREALFSDVTSPFCAAVSVR